MEEDQAVVVDHQVVVDPEVCLEVAAQQDLKLLQLDHQSDKHHQDQHQHQLLHQQPGVEWWVEWLALWWQVWPSELDPKLLIRQSEVWWEVEAAEAANHSNSSSNNRHQWTNSTKTKVTRDTKEVSSLSHNNNTILARTSTCLSSSASSNRLTPFLCARLRWTCSSNARRTTPHPRATCFEEIGPEWFERWKSSTHWNMTVWDVWELVYNWLLA